MFARLSLGRMRAMVAAVGLGLALWALAVGSLSAQAAPQGLTYIVAGENDGTGACAPAVGGYSCPTLRAAVVAANSNPGSTIQLMHGRTYTLTIAPDLNDLANTGDLNVNVNTTFGFGLGVCFSNCAATILAGPAFTDRLLHLGAGAQVAANLLILRGGHDISAAGGGGVLVETGSALTLTNSSVISNVAQAGGGVMVEPNAQLVLNNVQILSNTTWPIGAGAGLLNRGTTVITSSTFSGNYGDTAGGGIFGYEGRLLISNTTFSNNTVTRDGAGMYIRSGEAALMNSRILTNTISGVNVIGGAGLAVEPNATTAVVTLTNVTVSGNASSGDGGGIMARPDNSQGGTVTMTLLGGEVLTNTAGYYGGGVLFQLSTCTGFYSGCSNGWLTVNGVAVKNNSASAAGGLAIFISNAASLGSGAVISNSVITYNRALQALYGHGGGLNTVGATTVDNTEVAFNTAAVLGGGLFNGGGTLTIRGGSYIHHNTVGGLADVFTTGGGGLANAGILSVESSLIRVNAALTGSAGGLLNLASGVATVTYSDLSNNSASAFAQAGGGAVNSGQLTLANVSANSNQAGFAAGLYNAGGGYLTMTLGLVADNVSVSGAAAVYNAPGATFNATESILQNNLAQTDHGGAVINEGMAALSATQIVGNQAPLGWGGGIYSLHTTSHLTLNQVQILSNTAQGAAGLFNVDGLITATDCLIAHNTATAGSGGGVVQLPDNPPGAGFLWLDRSTLWDNQASDDGGGIYTAHALTLTNVTLAGNRAGGSGGGLFSDQGYDLHPQAALNNVTVYGNQADLNNTGTSHGGGLRVITGSVTLQNTLLGQNHEANAQSSDCAGPVVSGGYNLIQNAAGCGLTGSLTGNIIGQDPQLGGLQDNGGPTWTAALLTGSPAINAGNPAVPGSTASACVTVDQRGAGRPVGGRCDIGAYESNAALVLIDLPLVMR